MLSPLIAKAAMALLPSPGRLINALRYTGKGLQYAFKTEAAFRDDLLLVLILAPIGITQAQSSLERTVLLGVLLLLLITELLNSAVEAVVDLISPDQHPLAGAAKDMGSAAVLCALLLVGVAYLPVIFRVLTSFTQTY